MPREILRALDADVRRLLASGGATAPSDEGLRRRGEALRELGRKVPALAQVAAAVERVTGVPPAQGTGPFLDLLVLVGQVRAGLASAGCAGEVEEVPPSGPWASDRPTALVLALLDAMSRHGAAAAPARLLGDLRLLPPLQPFCQSTDEAMRKFLSLDALRRLRAQLLLELWPTLHCDPRAPRWLMTVCRENPAIGLDLAIRALEADHLMLREVALAAIAEAGAAASALIPALVVGVQDTRRAGRAAYARALGKIGPAAGDAVAALCAALEDESPNVRVAAAEALGQIRSPAALPALTTAANEAAPPEVKQAAERAIARIQNPRHSPS